MKTIKIFFISAVIVAISACRSSKKVTTAPVTINPESTNTNSILFVKPATGIYVPGDDELTAIQLKYKDVTLEKLKEGHFLYTQGVCVDCHNAKSIYQRTETQWKDIIDDMAQRSKLSDTQKDAVYKYVLAIKARQLR